MNAERKRLAREIFADALERGDPQERADFIAHACGTDAELRQLVEALLTAHERGGELPGQTMLVAPEQVVGERPGTIIGRYKLLQEIGEGGFGIVFMAEQLEPVQRKVALKIIKAGMDTREVIARFEAERQALALMDHPNIARVLDAGATENGRPYFVMELVKGIPITDYCEQQNLPVEGRLHLFIKVCHAVQHAHQKGIIHRDIKPSNVMITLHDGEAVPKVIDFGIAKATGQKLTDKTLFTRYEQLIGTPAYMSPEQAAMSGLDVDTRTDIYALGVLLYELLTGVTPYDKETLARAAFDEIRRMICETEPPKPSTRLHTMGEKLTEVALHRHTEPGMLRRMVRGDLDWIVMKALEKDRRRRYGTANDFAEEVQRHLKHEPVLASPPSTAYRARKYVRRHRVGVALSATAVTALLMGLCAAVVGFVQARQERNRAVAAEERALKERDRALTAEKEIEQERNHAELLAAEAALEKGQSKLEAGDSWGLWDLVEAYELAEHNPAIQQTAGRRWSTWHAYWDRRTIAIRPVDNGVLSPDHLQYASINMWPPSNTSREVYLRDTVSGAQVAGPLLHESAALAGAFSPDGRWFATLTDQGVIHLWDCRTSNRVRPPVGTGAVELDSLLFSGCGRYLVAFSRAHAGRQATKAAVLRLGNPGAPAQLLEHRYPVVDARFSPDGELLAILCKPDLQLWRTEDLQPVGSPLAVNMTGLLEFSGDGTRLAFNPQHPGGIGLLDTRTLRVVGNFPSKASPASFSHDGSLLAGCDWDCNVKLWRTDSGPEPYAVQTVGAKISGCPAFNPDDSLLAVGDFNGTIHLLRPSDGRIMQTLHTPQGPVPAFLTNGVLAANAHHVTHFWDLAASPLPDSSLPHDALAYSLEFDSSGTVLAVGSEDELRLWRMQPAPKLERKVPMPGRVLAVTFARADGRFVAFCDEGSLTAVEPRTGKTTTRGNFGRGRQFSACLSPDARRLALYRWYETLLLDTQTGAFQRLAYEGGTRSVAFRHDSRQMAMGVASWKIFFYDTAADTNAPMGWSPEFGGWVDCVGYHPNGRLLAVCVNRRVIRLYDIEGKSRVFRAYEPSLTGVDLLRFSPDGSVLAAAGPRSDGGYGIELWQVDLQRGLYRACAGLCCDHAVWSLAFSPDNRILVTGGPASTRLWQLPSEPENLKELQSRTRATLGFWMDEKRMPVYLNLPPDRVEEIRARLTQRPVSTGAPLDAALMLPRAKAVTVLRQLANRFPGDDVYRHLLGRLHADLIAPQAGRRLWKRALADAIEAIRLGHDDPYAWYERALLGLGADDLVSYRATCREMIEQYQASTDPAVTKWLGWAAALAPGALDDYADLVQQLRLSAQRAGGLHAPADRLYLGAVLGRAGRYAEAAVELEEVDCHLKAEGADVDFSPIYYKSLLAICHAHLGHEETARRWFDAAARDATNLLQTGQADAAAPSTVSWSRQLTIDLLQEEARSLLNGDGAAGAISPLQRAIAVLYWGPDGRGPAPGPHLDEAASPNDGPDPLARITAALLAAGKFAEAEPLALEWLATCEKLERMEPWRLDLWRTHDARSLLGASLLGQKKYAEAEAELLLAHRGMMLQQDNIPAQGKGCLGETLQRLVRLYEATGRPDQVNDWKEKLAEHEKAEETRLRLRIESEEARAQIGSALRVGWEAAQNQRWPEAAQAYAEALRHPAFHWPTYRQASSHECLGLHMGTAFVRAGDHASHERLCRFLLTALPAQPTVLEAERYAKLCFLDGKSLPVDLQRRGLEWGRFAVTNRLKDGLPQWTCQSGGIAECYAGDAERAVELLTEAERDPAIGCRGAAMVYRAMALKQLRRDAEAATLLQQAETLLAEPLSSRSGGVWWDLELCQIALEQARQLIKAPSKP